MFRGVVNVNPGDNNELLKQAHDRYVKQLGDALLLERGGADNPVEEVQLGDVVVISRFQTVLEAMKMSQNPKI